MPEIKFDMSEIVYQSSSPQTVDKYGRVSVGRDLAGTDVMIFAVEAK